MSKISTSRLLLLGILVISFWLRTYVVNWDDGRHFHPDERAIVLETLELHWVNPVTNWDEFRSVNSGMNPGWFPYGSLPLYLLAGVSWLLHVVTDNRYWMGYDGIVLVGRVISAMFDTATVLMVYLLGRELMSRRGALIAATWYGLAVFPVQVSHFYAVDTLLTFWAMLVVWGCLQLLKKQTWGYLLLIAVAWGLALATKLSGLVLGFPIGVALSMLVVSDWRSWSGELFYERIGKLSVYGLLLVMLTAVTFVIAEPYAWFDSTTFLRDWQQQSQMADDAWIFPYTRQYVGTLPYLYHLEQIVKWGLGWGVGIAGIAGLFTVLFLAWRKWKTTRMILNRKWLLVVGFFVVYWFMFGGFAVKFMRYMLPIYPIWCLLAVVGISGLTSWSRNQMVKVGLTGVVSLISVIWLLAFLSIYRNENPRLSASRWMGETLPPGSVLGIEHWDDALPVPPWHQQFTQLSFPLYEYDDERKWREMSRLLEQVDVIVLASNRLSAPLMRLPEKYAVSQRYYELLFAEELGFELAGEFVNYPRIGDWVIDDQDADESFTVYDHPRVLVFVKQTPYQSSGYFDMIYRDL